MSSGEDRYPRPNPKPRPKPKPKPKARPKPKPARAVMPGDPGFGTGTDARARAKRGTPGSTSARVKVGPKGRVTQPKYRQRAKPDADFAAWAADVDAAKKPAPKSSGQPTGLGPGERAVAGVGGAPNVGGLLDIIANAGGDAVDIVTGVPSLAMLAGKNAAAFAPFSPAPYARIAHEMGVPGTAWSKKVQSSAIKDDTVSGKALVADYKYRYGPYFRGDIGEGWKRTQEDPLITAMDIATVWSGAGGAARLGMAGAGKVAPGTRIGAAAARQGSRAYGPGTARFREPRKLLTPMNDEAGVAQVVATTLKGGPTPRPFSANPITRHIQRKVGRVLDKRAEKSARAPADSMRGKAYRARVDMIQRRMARDHRLSVDTHVRDQVEFRTRELNERMHRLTKDGKWNRDQADMAAALHAQDVLDVPGKTPIEAARDIAAGWERTQSKAKLANQRVKHRQKNPETLREIIDHHPELLDLKNGPETLRSAVDEYKAVAAEASDIRIEAGTLRSDTARARKQGTAQELHGTVNPEAIMARRRATGQDPNLPLVVRNHADPYSPVGKKGVYLKHELLDKASGSPIRQPGGQAGRRTLDRDYETTYAAVRGGNVRMDRGLPARSLERAIMDRTHPGAVEDLYETIAYRNVDDGKLTRGPKAKMAFMADHDAVTLVSIKSLKDTRRALDDVPDGTMPDSPFSGVDLLEGKEGLGRLTAIPDSAMKDYVAVPSAAIKGMREGWESMVGGKQMKWFDTPQALWKRGILALAPRWYVNSLVGNTMMYGMATGGDLRTIMRVMRNRNLSDAVPGRIRGATNVQEAKVTEGATANRASARYRKITDPLIGKQSAFDALFRKALYVKRVKQGLRAEGVKTRGMTPDEFAEAVRTAPKHVVNQAMREAELFLGDYIRLSPGERAILRRAFPFYSWMRVIGRFMLEVPIRHPKRAGITAAMATAAQDSQNPLDPMQPLLADRGRLMADIPGLGKVAQRSAGWNPAFTHIDLAKNITGRDFQGTLGSVASNLSPIGAQQLARTYSGTTAFGAPVTFPPGKDGSYSSYGGSTMRDDPTTMLPDFFTPGVPLEESILQTIPLAPAIIRGIASGDRTPYDTTTTRELLDAMVRGGGDTSQLFKTQRDKAMTPIPGVSPILGWAGLNFQRYDEKADLAAIKKRAADAREAKKTTTRRKLRSKKKG